MNWLVWAEFLQSYYIIPFGMFILVIYIGYRFYLKYITPAKNLNTQLESEPYRVYRRLFYLS